MVLAAALSLTLAVPSAMANEAPYNTQGNIIVNKVEPGATVKGYRVVEAYEDTADKGILKYRFAPAVQTWLGTTTMSDLKVQDLANSATAKKFSQAAYAAIKSGDLVLSESVLVESGGAYYAVSRDIGQYLIVVSGTSGTIYEATTVNLMPAMAADGKSYEFNDTVDVDMKSTTVTVEKRLLKPMNHVDSHGSGDTIEFIIEANVPSYPSNATNKTFKISDVLPAGLTMDKASFGVYDATGTVPADPKQGNKIVPGEGYSISWDANGFTVTFKDGVVNGASKVYIIYGTTMDALTSLDPTGYTNTATMTYANDPYNPATFDVTSEATVFTYGISILKQDGASKAKLSGATFKLEKEDKGTWTTFGPSLTTDGEGIVNAYGLDEGKYRLTETTAPSGYNMLTEPVEFTITGSTTDGVLDGGIVADPNMATVGVLDITVDNYAGITFPETGDMGTAVFTVIGLLLAGAGVTLYFGRRKNSTKE